MSLLLCTLSRGPSELCPFPFSLWELGGGYWRDTGEAEGKIHIKPIPQMTRLDIDKALVELEGHLKHKSFPRLQEGVNPGSGPTKQSHTREPQAQPTL